MNRVEIPSAGRPTLGQALRFWLKLGFISFGGPTGQIAIMHHELVDRRKWISESRFLHALNYCMLLPGPEAQQLATYAGWLLHGTVGGILAGALFVLPSVFILLALSWIYMAHGSVPSIAAVLSGLKPAVTALVAFAVIRIGTKTLRNPVMYAVAGLAFVAIFFLKTPFPLIILGAGLIGWLGVRFHPKYFSTPSHGSAAAAETEPLPASTAQPTLGRAIKVVTICLALWWLPVVLLGLAIGWDSLFVKQGVFFSKAALVTFGGAYAVLPYVAQAAVHQYGWLSPEQMMDGLALAETTPGPLIMVLQFVGFVAGWQQPGALAVALAAVISALLTTWVTFLPSFLWIFLGAPYIETLRGQARLGAVLTSITAAIVGVVLNLAIWFGIHTLLPDTGGINYLGIAVGVVAFLGLWRFKWNTIAVVLGSGAVGLLNSWFAGV